VNFVIIGHHCTAHCCCIWLHGPEVVCVGMGCGLGWTPATGCEAQCRCSVYNVQTAPHHQLINCRVKSGQVTGILYVIILSYVVYTLDWTSAYNERSRPSAVSAASTSTQRLPFAHQQPRSLNHRLNCDFRFSSSFSYWNNTAWYACQRQFVTFTVYSYLSPAFENMFIRFISNFKNVIFCVF